MALLNKHGRLTVDPCILNAAKDVVKFANEVARKSDHVASDLLITAVWCCMNCSCSQANKVQGPARSGSQPRDDDSLWIVEETKQDRTAAKKKSPEPTVSNKSRNSSIVQESRKDNTTVSDAQKQSVGANTVASAHETSVRGKLTKNDQANSKDCSTKDVAENVGVSESCRKDKQKSSEPADTGAFERAGNDYEINTNEAEIDELIVMDDEDNDDIDGETEALLLSEDDSKLSASGIQVVLAEEKDAKSLENEQGYFDMDCDEIDEDQQFETENSDTSKLDISKAETEAGDEIMIISDDELEGNIDENPGSELKDNEKIRKETHATIKQSKNNGKDSNDTESKTSKNATKLSEQKKKRGKQPKEPGGVEVISLDSDSESEEQNNSGSKKEGSLMEVKKESGIDVEQMSVFSRSVMEDLDSMSVDNTSSVKKEIETDTGDQLSTELYHTDGQNVEQPDIERIVFGRQDPSDSTVNNSIDVAGMASAESDGSDLPTSSDCTALQTVGDTAHTMADTVHTMADTAASFPVSQQLAPMPASSEFGPAMIGLVPNRHLVPEQAPQPGTITATTITFYSAGPSWAGGPAGPSWASGPMTHHEQPMPYMVQQTTQSMVASSDCDTSPASKKRLLDFDKKWHMEPKLDRYHDRYLALPGGIEGNSVDSIEDRQRKIASRNLHSSWATDFSSTPQVTMENVGDGTEWHGHDTDTELSIESCESSDEENGGEKSAGAKRGRPRGRLKWGSSTRGNVTTGTRTKKATKEVPKVASRASKGRPRGQRTRGQSSVSGRGRGKGSSSPGTSQGSPSKGAATSGQGLRRIGFYSVRRGAGGRGLAAARGGTRGGTRGARGAGLSQTSRKGMTTRQKSTEMYTRSKRGVKRRGK